MNVKRRLKTHAGTLFKYGAISVTMLKDGYRKNNYKNYDFLVLETFEDNTITDKQLRQREAYYINKYKSNVKGYNVSDPYPTGKYGDSLLKCPKMEPRKTIKRTAKTAEYTKRAVDNYRNKFDFIQVRFEKELNIKDRLKAQGSKIENVNDYINKLVLEDLEKLEREPAPKDLNVIGIIED